MSVGYNARLSNLNFVMCNYHWFVGNILVIIYQHFGAVYQTMTHLPQLYAIYNTTNKWSANPSPA